MKNGEMLSKAILLATVGHNGQFDKGGNPYILHPLTVMHKLKSKDEELMCIAVLHDYIEDVKGATFEQLRNEGMSERVIEGIRCITKMPGQTYEEYKTAVFSNRDTMLVKREDLRTNSDLRRLKSKTINDKDIARVAKYMSFYAEIEVRLGETG